MDQELQRYLNDHLAGASGAVVLIQHFVDTMDESEARDYFMQLKGKVESDIALLEDLLTSAGMQTSGVHKAAGNVTVRVGYLKLLWEGFEPGGLGLLEGLELLALGVQGKRLLWVSLNGVAHWFPEWKDVDFSKLEREAVEQRDGVEFWRFEAAKDVLVRMERRAAVANSHPA